VEINFSCKGIILNIAEAEGKRLERLLILKVVSA
jgi:hypothetical protein